MELWNKNYIPTRIVEGLRYDERTQSLMTSTLRMAEGLLPTTITQSGYRRSPLRFSDDVAARLAKGEPITFQDNSERPVRVASFRMRKQRCKCMTCTSKDKARMATH
ncbi:MAG: hypothetical protein DME65_12545, partial [Verrucomicrobia bacterium]